MARYYLNLFNDEDAVDEDGIEVADLAVAKARAIAGGRGLMAEHVVLGRPINLSHRIEVCDDSGKPLAVIPFREMITIVEA